MDKLRVDHEAVERLERNAVIERLERLVSEF